MLLAVDVGNTSTVLGMFEGDRLVASWRVATDRMRMADEYAVFLTSLLQLDGVGMADAAVVSSVVPPVERELSWALKRYWNVDSLTIGSDLLQGAGLLTIETDNPREVGADRMVNAVAALQRPEEAFIVVDFGTATNFDVVVKPDRLLGVALAPGPGVAAEALFARAAKLPRVDLVAPARAIGTNTVAALQSGLVFGYAEMVDGMVGRLRQEIDAESVCVIATGGFARTLEGHCRRIDVYDDLLTLTGLRLIAQRMG